MATEKITVNRALVEMKRIDDRIDRAIDSGQYVARTIGSGTSLRVVGGLNVTEDQVKAKIQASFDSVDALIKNREQIKAKIVLSNAATMVTILGRQMSVAEAIELKTTVAVRQRYLDTMRRQFVKAKLDTETANVALDTEIQTAVSSMCGSDKKVDEAMLQSVTNVKKQQKEPKILDPQNIENRIKKLEDEISDLSSELNFVLSDSNSQTFIEVEIQK